MKKVKDQIVYTILSMLVVFHGVMFFSGVESYNEIGNSEYLAHYSELINETAGHIPFSIRECVVNNWALTTKEKIGGIFDAGFYGAMLPLTILTSGAILPPKRSRPLRDDYPLVVTKQETSYFVEKCSST